MPDRACPECAGTGRVAAGPEFPQRGPCAACGRPVIAAESRTTPGLGLLFDPEPDGDGEHFDTILADDLSRILGSGEATERDCKGRFPLYRSHFWTCPKGLMPDA